mmetsp:Transcript_6607/g.7584  ORF Transcript_6607/g.7584 Transcript_6607/m.7584 type:complete len:111 (+) Transcript_6607:1828-2160(+)
MRTRDSDPLQHTEREWLGDREKLDVSFIHTVFTNIFVTSRTSQSMGQPLSYARRTKDMRARSCATIKLYQVLAYRTRILKRVTFMRENKLGSRIGGKIRLCERSEWLRKR